MGELDAVRRLHRKYHGIPIGRAYVDALRTGQRRSQMSRWRRGNGQGIPNGRPALGERMEIHMTAAEYEVNRARQRRRLPYRGSAEERENRGRRGWGRR